MTPFWKNDLGIFPVSLGTTDQGSVRRLRGLNPGGVERFGTGLL